MLVPMLVPIRMGTNMGFNNLTLVEDCAEQYGLLKLVELNWTGLDNVI